MNRLYPTDPDSSHFSRCLPPEATRSQETPWSTIRSWFTRRVSQSSSTPMIASIAAHKDVRLYLTDRVYALMKELTFSPDQRRVYVAKFDPPLFDQLDDFRVELRAELREKESSSITDLLAMTTKTTRLYKELLEQTHQFDPLHMRVQDQLAELDELMMPRTVTRPKTA